MRKEHGWRAGLLALVLWAGTLVLALALLSPLLTSWRERGEGRGPTSAPKPAPAIYGPAPVRAEKLNPAPVPVEFRPLPGRAHAVYAGALLARDGRVYTAACRGKRPGRLYVYDPKTDEIEICATFTSGARRGGEDGEPLPPDVAPTLDDGPGAWLHGHDKIHARLYEGPEGRIYGATDSAVANERPNNTRVYAGGHFFAYDPKTEKVIDLGWARRHEGIIAMSMDPERMILYGLTWPSGLLVGRRVKWEEDGQLFKKLRPRILGLATSGLQGVPRYFDVLADGRVFTCDGHTGDILVYVPWDYKGPLDPPGAVKTGRLMRPTGLVTPFRPDPSPPPVLRYSNRYRNWWRTGVLSPDGKRIWTSGQRGGQLVEIDGTAGTLGRVRFHPHAKPWAGEKKDSWGGETVSLLGFDPKEKLFYRAEGHLLSYAPAKGEVRDWGVFTLAGESDMKVGIGIGPAAFDKNGRMYFGASRRDPEPPEGEKEEVPAGDAEKNPEETPEAKPAETPEGKPEAPPPAAEAKTAESPGKPSEEKPALKADEKPEAEAEKKKRRRWQSGLGWIDLSKLGEGKLLYTEPREE